MELISILQGKSSATLDDKERVQERIALWAAIGIGLSVGFYSILLWIYSEWLPAVIWSGFSLYNLVLVLIYPQIRKKIPITKFLSVAVTVQLLLGLIAPFAVSFLLGSFVRLGYPAFAMIMPLASLVFHPKRVPLWTGLSIVMIVTGVVMEPYLSFDPNLPQWVVSSWFLGATLGSLLVAIGMLYYLMQQRDLAMSLLAAEQQKSENLLLNILPPEIAEILKREEATKKMVAEQFDGATILFADVVNFTPLSAGMAPNELVSILNEVFSMFDDLVEEYGLEKIKTIGDCYMVAAGVPRPRADHAIVQTQLALDMRELVSQRKFQGQQLSFRIGLNSGPVVAGVIGRKKFIYDLWGDAVNTASRMESHGAPNAIQITRATYEQIRDRFTCEPRGKITVKGKGEMEIWHVIGATQQ